VRERAAVRPAVMTRQLHLFDLETGEGIYGAGGPGPATTRGGDATVQVGGPPAAG